MAKRFTVSGNTPGLTAGGFSILELVVVVTILSILASLSIPNILKWVALSKIDAVKTILNSAAAECLQDIRTGKDPQAISPSGSTISNENLGSYGYQIEQNNSRCASFFLNPANENETFMYRLGFKIDASGKILKIAMPATDQGSLTSCTNWAGVNCTASPEQQAAWNALAKLEADKKACNDAFYSWIQKSGTGQFKRWDENTNSCSTVAWAYKGIIQKDEDSMKNAKEAELGPICSERLKQKESSKYDGLFQDAECGATYFCSGKDLLTEDQAAYQACKEEERQIRCTAALGDWKSRQIDGKFNEIGCTAQWQCGGIILSSQSDYDASSCGCRWVDEQYQTGTTTEKIQTGTTIQRQCAAYNRRRRCIRYRNVSVPTYQTVTKPTYETKRVCKKN